MKMLAAILVISIARAYEEAPKSMVAFNKICPAPKLCDRLGESRDECQINPKKCDEFVDILAKLLPVYDCLELTDTKKSSKYLVPAIFLCDRFGPKLALENAVRLLSQLKSERALKVFGSEALRKTLDGNLAEEFLAKSREAAKQGK